MLNLSPEKWLLRCSLSVSGLGSHYFMLNKYTSLVKVKLFYTSYFGVTEKIYCGKLFVVNLDNFIVTTRDVYQNWEVIYYFPVGTFRLQFRPANKQLKKMLLKVWEYKTPISAIESSDLQSLII